MTVCDKGSGVVENTEEGEMVEIRKIITTREVVLSELGVAAP